jgi:hypothetical protein
LLPRGFEWLHASTAGIRYQRWHRRFCLEGVVEMKEQPNSDVEIPTEKTGELDPRIGLLGELAVEMQIVQQGWHPVRLDTAQMASNADLLAVNRKRRVSIQVKTTNAQTQHEIAQHRDGAGWLSFGYATNYLRNGTNIFNSKKSPLIADVVIAVGYHPMKPRFVIMPVVVAEILCRRQCDFWAAVPTKANKKRSLSFPISLPFMADRQVHKEHFDSLKRNVLKYENAWHVLLEDIDKLHDPKKWKLFP